MDIAAWLERIGLGGHGGAFAANGIDAVLLPSLTNDDLKDLGIGRLADRKRLLEAIRELSEIVPVDRPEPVKAVPEGERRQVTVLFADIVGYTKLVSKHGAERIHGLLNSYFAAVDALIENYGGRVDKHIGDNVMAVFGAPIAHDDDPVRAVRTALDIHENMSVLSDEFGIPVRAHVGIASGQVVASGTGSDTHREYTVTGESVNLAARLQDKAAPGETLISEAVRHAISGRAVCESLGNVAVKGIDAPVRIWRVTSLRGEGEAAARRDFVGRQAELQLLTGVLDSCRTSGLGHAIAVRGEAGIGKTRLVEEFIAIAASRQFVAHKALVLDFGVGKGRDAVRSIVRSMLGLPQGSGKAARQEAVKVAIANGLLAASQRIFLNDLMDLSQSPADSAIYDAISNDARTVGKRSVTCDLLAKVSAISPIALIVEDIHWANPLMLKYLASMAETVANCRSLLIMTSRAESYPLDSAWRGTTGGCPLTTIDLGPLRAEDAQKLAGAFIDTTKQSALNCIARAEGNPLFLVQLLHNAQELDERDMPATIQSLVLSRMDRLPAADKQALQAASVLGQRFSLDALHHLLGSQRYDCKVLIESNLARPEGDGFLFAHALVQEGVYESLLDARRRSLHLRAAAWCVDREPALRAQHLDRAGDPQASDAYLQAARAQVAAFHFESALGLIKRGLELVGGAANRYELECLRGDVLRNTGVTEESITAFTAALEAAEDDPRRVRARIGIAGGLRIADRQQAALEVLANAERGATQHGLLAELAQIHYLRGNVYFPLGDIAGCLREHETALRYARQIDSSEAEARALGGLGDAHYLRGHMRSACEQFRACVAICEIHGYRSIAVANRHMIGWTRMHLMEFAEALEDAQVAIRMASEVSNHRAKLLGLMLSGLVEFELGQAADARLHSQQALELARTIGASNFEAHCLVTLARVACAQGQVDEALKYAGKAIGVAREAGMTFIGPTALAVAAVIAGAAPARRDALAEAERILDSECVAHNHFWFAQAAIDCSIELGQWDEAKKYAARLETYTRAQPLPWSDFMIARGRTLAAWGEGRRDPEILAELAKLQDMAARAGLATALPALQKAIKAAGLRLEDTADIAGLKDSGV